MTVAIMLLTSCVKDADDRVWIDSDTDLEAVDGSLVAVRGKALNAKLNAVLATNGTDFGLLALEAWPDELYGRDVVVRGRLRREVIEALAGSDTDIRAVRAPGMMWVIDEASWALAGD